MSEIDKEKIAQLKKASANNRIGGKGTARRKVVAKARPPQDDSKLYNAIDKMNLQAVSGVDEVNLFREDGTVIHFNNAQVRAQPQGNTFAVFGNGREKELTDLVPGILSQLGPESIAQLKRIVEQYQSAQAAGLDPKEALSKIQENADEDAPALVDNSAAAPAEETKMDDLN